MNISLLRTLLVTVMVASVSMLVMDSRAQAKELSATDIIEKSQLAFYYPGNDGKANINMELIDKSGGKRVRKMTMLRMDEAEGGKQKYFVYFYEPGDVRRMTFMVWKYPDRDDERWIFIPAVDLVRRIAADDKRSSFVGSDFTYEDISGRDIRSETQKLLREESMGGNDCYVVESIPKKPIDYTKIITWVDKKTFLPLKEEYYDIQNSLFKVYTADKVENVPHPTATKRTMKNLKTGHTTLVTLSDISFDIGLNGEDFSERNMRKPPRDWLK